MAFRQPKQYSGKEANDEDPAVTEGELRMLINIGESEGSVDFTEAARVQRVFSFGDRQIQEIVTPRPEIVWIEKGCTLGEFLAVHAEKQSYEVSGFLRDHREYSWSYL
ncbi:MAG: hypothetical protein Ct9H300mP27_05440 [Chloroflexota bacterium]|nr:MAG: hypothetical protein Ct9H300mP27_05440 [Chloroflexota bacterium]